MLLGENMYICKRCGPGNRTAPLSEMEGEKRTQGRRQGRMEGGGRARQRERVGREVRNAAQLDAALDQHASIPRTRDKRRGCTSI